MKLTQLAAGSAILAVLAAQAAWAQPAPPPPDQPAPVQSAPPPPPDQPPPPPAAQSMPGQPAHHHRPARHPAHRRKPADRPLPVGPLPAVRRRPPPSIPTSICGRDRVPIIRSSPRFPLAPPSMSAAAMPAGVRSPSKGKAATSSRQVSAPRRPGRIRPAIRRHRRHYIRRPITGLTPAITARAPIGGIAVIMAAGTGTGRSAAAFTARRR